MSTLRDTVIVALLFTALILRWLWGGVVRLFTDRLPEDSSDELRSGWFEGHVDIRGELIAMERAQRQRLRPMLMGVGFIILGVAAGLAVIDNAPGIGEEDPHLVPTDTGETVISVQAPSTAWLDDSL